MLFWNSSYSKEEIQELLKNKREAIKRSPEYYGIWSPSNNPDYMYYKKLLLYKNNS